MSGLWCVPPVVLAPVPLASDAGDLGPRIGNPDDTAIIERPCRTYDMNCIREFFAKHAHCKKSYLQVPDPLVRPQSIEYMPRLNLTVTIPNQINNGLNGRVEEFYINKDTDNLVIAVEFRNLTKTANDTYYTFHRRAKEPVVTRGFATATFPSLIITAVIPNIDNLQLERGEFTTYANDRVYPFVIGPTIAESTDPQVQRTVAEIPADIATTSQEIYLKDSAFYICTFIQYKICDFGLKLT